MAAPSWFTPVLWAHIGVGVAALVAGAGAMVSRKGSRLHRRFGAVYVAGTAGVVLSAFALTSATRDLFLASIAVFSGYMVFAGYRALAQKPRGRPATRLDYAAGIVMVVVAVGMVALGGWGVLVEGRGRSVVLVAFGALALAFAGQDLLTFRRGPSLRFDWFYRHIARMLGSYIATVTAVSAVNLFFLPTVVRWLWPTAVGTPLIALWIRRYQRRFGENGTPRDIAAALTHGTDEPRKEE
ncbi:hypothetical protein U3A55_00210 [Salarchaeum sp. III]|uniref:hypothetical protein n=1 Tax=Salarchaeum sp. III TaxID=3107927 RepID=UPI002ED9C3B8